MQCHTAQSIEQNVLHRTFTSHTHRLNTSPFFIYIIIISLSTSTTTSNYQMTTLCHSWVSRYFRSCCRRLRTQCICLASRTRHHHKTHSHSFKLTFHYSPTFFYSIPSAVSRWRTSGTHGTGCSCVAERLVREFPCQSRKTNQTSFSIETTISSPSAASITDLPIWPILPDTVHRLS